MWDVALDLVLGSACSGCDRPGRLLCGHCRHSLPRRGRPAWPSPSPSGLAPPWAAGDYDGVLRALVNAHKEHRAFALARSLGDVLAPVVADLLAAAGSGGSVALVPVPSRGRVVRSRGHDPLLRVARRAASRLRRGGHDVRVTRLLRPPRQLLDQAGLDAGQRAENLAGAFRALRSAGRNDSPLVVVDDVITTGATAREAQRALEDSGFTVLGVAAVAATVRRHPGRGPGALPIPASAD